MTREEAKVFMLQFNTDKRLNPSEHEAVRVAIKVLEQEHCEDWYDVPSDEMTLEQARQAVKDLRKKLAEHLEQDPCNDAISRQAVEKITWEEPSYTDALNVLTEVRDKIRALPSVKPQEPKTGHWIRVTDKTGHLVWECDKCGWQQKFNTNYCPDCGCEMLPTDSESEERNDKQRNYQ